VTVASVPEETLSPYRQRGITVHLA
jgi:hypothetical protein